jgi:hypothetical protein
MSDSEGPSGQGHRGQEHRGQEHRDQMPVVPVARRSGWLTAFMILAGIVLLFPGLCVIFFVVLDWRMALDSSLISVWAVCLGIAFGGIMLIRAAVRGPRS